MRSTIRTGCARCGTVEVPIDGARLVAPAVRDHGGLVEFTCPRCGQPGSHRVDARGERLLIRAGITLVVSADVPEVAPAGDDSDRGGAAG